MTWLNAALAFAITMLILSMSTSVIVETMHRLVGLREKGLRVLVERFYEKVVTPYIVQAGSGAGNSKAEFVQLMTAVRPSSRQPPPVVPGKKQVITDSHLGTQPMIRILAGDQLSHLNVNDFMSRLGKSSFGDAVRAVLAQDQIANPEDALKSIAEEFDAYGREVSAYFERRARLLSVIVAIVIAFALYVHPYDIFKTYLSDPQTAANVIKMRDDVKVRYEQAVKDAEQAPADSIKQSTEQDLKASLDQAEQAAADTLSSLKSAGTPIGWDDQKWKALGISGGTPGWVGLSTVLWLIVGGFLVGLGGPFWYDMVNSLSSLLTLVTGAKKMADTLNLKPPADAGEPQAPQPQTPVEHFNAAAASRLATTPLASADAAQPVG